MKILIVTIFFIAFGVLGLLYLGSINGSKVAYFLFGSFLSIINVAVITHIEQKNKEDKSW